jgi:hypothetical protein
VNSSGSVRGNSATDRAALEGDARSRKGQQIIQQAERQHGSGRITTSRGRASTGVALWCANFCANFPRASCSFLTSGRASCTRDPRNPGGSGRNAHQPIAIRLRDRQTHRTRCCALHPNPVEGRRSDFLMYRSRRSGHGRAILWGLACGAGLGMARPAAVSPLILWVGDFLRRTSRGYRRGPPVTGHEGSAEAQGLRL